MTEEANVPNTNAVEDTVPEELLKDAVDVSIEQNGGVKKVILREGTGEDKPGVGDEVVVHYTGTLLDGTKFDSSRDRDDKFSFKLGMQRVIKAWDEGVASMKRGELCRLVCRSDYAYGERGSPPNIPPNATLIFEVELFDWKGEDLSEGETGGIIKSTKVAGSGYATPNEGAQVQVEVKGTFDGKVFDERSISFAVGDADESKLPEGVDIAVRKMKKGETAVVTLSPDYAFGSEGSKDYNIPGSASVKYELTLKDFEKAKESWEMDPDEKLSQSELAKNKGTQLFKAGQFKSAVRKYKVVTKYQDDDMDYTDEQKEKRAALNLAAHLNMALCYLKLESWGEARESCNTALEFDESSEKAFFRRGQSYMGTNDWEEAKADFNQALSIDPENKTTRNQIIKCDHYMKQEKEKAKKMYANMFSKPSSDINTASTKEEDGGSAV